MKLIKKITFLLTIKTISTLILCFPVLKYICDLLLGLENQDLLIIIIYFIIYQGLVIISLLFINFQKILYLVDGIVVLVSIFLFIFLTLMYFTNSEGYWVWVYYPVTAALFYFGLLNIALNYLITHAMHE